MYQVSGFDKSPVQFTASGNEITFTIPVDHVALGNPETMSVFIRSGYEKPVEAGATQVVPTEIWDTAPNDADLGKGGWIDYKLYID